MRLHTASQLLGSLSVKAMHTHNEQTTGTDEGGQQVRAVVATNPLPGERKLETNCL